MLAGLTSLIRSLTTQVDVGDLFIGFRAHRFPCCSLYVTPSPNQRDDIEYETNSSDGVYTLLQVIQAKTNSTTASLQAKGMNYQNGRLSVKTDRVAPTREEYIASTQRAFEKGGQVFKNHPSAFSMGAAKPADEGQGKSSSVDSTP